MSSSVIAFPQRPVGVISISVDIGLASDDVFGAGASHDDIQSVCIELLDRFNKRQIAASWALASLATAVLTRQILQARPGHEIALLAGSQTSSGSQSRGEIVQRIVRPIQQAAESGVAVSSIAFVGGWRRRHVDLLAKRGITMVRGTSRQHAGQRIEPVCYGMWYVPVAVDIRGGGWVANHAQLRLARRAIGLTMRDNGLCHLRIDVAALAKGDVACSLRTFDRLLRDLAQVRDAGQIAIETLRDTAARLAPRRILPAARSILRAA
jgi:hypothetical protein